MDKYATYLDLGTTRTEEQELDLFPFLAPTLRYSSTPTLLIYTRHETMKRSDKETNHQEVVGDEGRS